MKSNFKYIVTGIICCLCIVFLFQLFWLKGLYRSIESETKNRLIEFIMKADQAEQQIRLDGLKGTSSEDNTIIISKTFASLEDTTSNQMEDITSRQIINKGDTATTVSKKERDITIAEIDAILLEVKTVLHQVMDSIIPININTMDSLLVAIFAENNINAKFYGIVNVDFKTDSVMASSVDGARITNRAEVLVYKYDNHNQLGYKVYTEPLTKAVLQQMSGILVTTFLIIVVLGFAFWYLIKTVLRQKTLEEMKDDFTNNMTHELKTPIAVAYSAADALLNFKQGDNKEKRDKYLTICKDQLSELSGLVEQILSMSMERRQTFVLNKEKIQVDSLVSNLVTQHRLKAGKDIIFNIKIIPGDMTVFADCTHLNNMLSNLIDNAVRYSGESVNIDINVYQQNKYTVFEVRDNGMGIPSEKLAYVFDKFYRVTHGNKYGVKGYGLGLFYVKTMVEKHGGTASVNSIVGKGSVFTLKIPQ